MKTPPETLNGKPQLPRCGYAEVFEDIAKEIFVMLTPHTTKEQYQEAEECLLSLRNDLQRRMSRFHFPSPTGFHWCVADCYLESVFRLKIRALLAPKAPIDAPKPRLLSPEEVVNNLGEVLSLLPEQGLTLPKDTFLGEER